MEPAVPVKSARSRKRGTPRSATIARRPEWQFFKMGDRRHGASHEREAFCLDCTAATGEETPIRGDQGTMRRHLNSCRNLSADTRKLLSELPFPVRGKTEAVDHLLDSVLESPTKATLRGRPSKNRLLESSLPADTNSKMKGSDRTRLPEWKFFRKGDRNYLASNQREAFCLGCTAVTGQEVALRGEQLAMRRHLSLCQNLSTDTRQQLGDLLFPQPGQKPPLEVSRVGRVQPVDTDQKRPLETSLDVSMKRLRPSTLDAFVERPLDGNEKLGLQRMILDTFIAANIPFVTVENQHFRRMLAHLRPGITAAGVIPTQQRLAGVLLDQRAKAVEFVADKALRDCDFVGLTLDEWTDDRDRKIIGFALTVGTGTRKVETFLLSTEDVSDEDFDADFAVKKIEEAVGLAKERHNVSVRCVTIDLAGAHVKARRLMAIQHPDIIALPCYSHQIKLIFKHIITGPNALPLFKDVCSKAVHLLTAITSDTQILDRIHALQTETLASPTVLCLPLEIHWQSFSTTFQALLEMMNPILTLASNPDSQCLPDDVFPLLQDETFWRDLKTVTDVLRPLVKVQTVLATDSVTLSNVITGLRDMYLTFALEQGATRDLLLEKLESRWENFGDCRLMILACVFDPAVKLSIFAKRTITTRLIMTWACDFFRQIFAREARQLVEPLRAYLVNDSPFDDPVYAQFNSPVGFWKFVGDEYAELGELGVFMAKINPCAAGIKQHWNSMRSIHSTAGSRFALDRVEKLTAVKMQLEQSAKAESVARAGNLAKLQLSPARDREAPGVSDEVSPDEVGDFSAEDMEEMFSQLDAVADDGEPDLVQWLQQLFQNNTQPVVPFFTLDQLFGDASVV